eukprot:1084060-Prorocentrum_lima.AAC.1
MFRSSHRQSASTPWKGLVCQTWRAKHPTMKIIPAIAPPERMSSIWIGGSILISAPLGAKLAPSGVTSG